jgi:hypothetical protein
MKSVDLLAASCNLPVNPYGYLIRIRHTLMLENLRGFLGNSARVYRL